jgi:PTH1 family peptidyl-tRNA hydrolase
MARRVPESAANPVPSGKPPLLIVGLGNPDREYAGTRHNAGAMAVAGLARELGVQLKRKYFRRHFLAEAGGATLARADTFMNECGPVIAGLAKSRPRSVLLVVSDDLDLEPGKVRFRTGGSAGGHRGLASVISALGDESFPRLRIGIGRPPTAGSDEVRGEVIDWVLSRPHGPGLAEFEKGIEKAARALAVAVESGLGRAMTEFSE